MDTTGMKKILVIIIFCRRLIEAQLFLHDDSEFFEIEHEREGSTDHLRTINFGQHRAQQK